jgi:hypothetical protein
MKRTAIDAAGFFLALAAVLSLLFIPSAARPTDDHSMKEVEASVGIPQSFRHTTCGGSLDRYGKKIPGWPCTVWQYAPDKDGDQLFIYFDRKTGHVGTANMWLGGKEEFVDEATRVLVSKRLHTWLHAKRDGVDPEGT